MAKHKLWEVTYTYKVSHADGTEQMRESYLVVAGDTAEAFKKTEGCFSSTDLYQELLVAGEAHAQGVDFSDLHKNAREYRRIISFPKLTLDTDLDQFSLKPNIGSDGQTLEFIV